MTTVLIEHIALDDQGIARITGTRMKVIHLVMDKMANNSTPEDMARAFAPLSLAQIHAALSYYYDHQAQLDAQIERTLQDTDAMRAESGTQPTRDELVARLRRKDSDAQGGQ
jgi:uncharacterized protein (DUF433 family)